MLDPQVLRNRLDEVAAALKPRGFDLDTATLERLETRRKSLQIETQELQRRRNASAKTIGEAKSRGQDVNPLLAEVADQGDRLARAEADLAAVLAGDRGPESFDPQYPPRIRPAGGERGRQCRDPAFRRAAGSALRAQGPRGPRPSTRDDGFRDRGAYRRGALRRPLGGLAHLHRALTQFMLDLHTREHGYREVYVPYLANAQALRGTGRTPQVRGGPLRRPRTRSLSHSNRRGAGHQSGPGPRPLPEELP